ncbi:MAG: fumarylacetoacetate hydrolase family protein [Acidobacteriota bacterium]|nr:fumarylacetoacetate hydrolase family protein [Acidobacteriota bacterium]
MKLCTFEVQTQLGRHRRLGAITEGGIVDLNFAYAAYLAGHGERRPQKVADVLLPANMLEFLQAAAMPRAVQALEAAGERGVNGETIVYAPGNYAKDGVRLLAPLPNPASVRDFYAFESHVRGGFEKRGEPMPKEWYEIPVYYKSGHHHIIGTDEDVHWPSFTQKFDYELELAAVIGEAGRNISAAEAHKHIAGYTVMNDFSARDIQRQEMKVRLGPAKGKDWATAIGPYLVTPDEIGDPYNLAMTARVNGEIWSEGNSRSIHWTFAQMIEFLTRDDEIVPGDLIGSGTVGNGCGLELDRWVKRGDVMELEIEKIGQLRNRVV